MPTFEWRELKCTVRDGLRHFNDTPRNEPVMVAIASSPDDSGGWGWIKAVAYCDEYGIPHTIYGYGGTIRYWAPVPEDPPRDMIDREIAEWTAKEAARVEQEERGLLASPGPPPGSAPSRRLGPARPRDGLEPDAVFVIPQVGFHLANEMQPRLAILAREPDQFADPLNAAQCVANAKQGLRLANLGIPHEKDLRLFREQHPLHFVDAVARALGYRLERRKPERPRVLQTFGWDRDKGERHQRGV